MSGGSNQRKITDRQERGAGDGALAARPGRLARTVLLLVGVAALGAFAAVADGKLGAAAGPQATPVTVTVTAGKPSEFKFKLSKTSMLPVGSVTFKVTNKGAIPHNFKVCARPVLSTVKSACVGKVTPTLQKGASATLTLKLAKGQYEFLCAVPGHAAAGMKGLIGVGVKVTPAPTTTTTTTTTTGKTTTGATTTTTTATTTTATTTAGGTEALQGDPVAGASVFAANGCASCHTLAAAGASGTVGPNLDLAKPSQAIVRLFVTNGGGGGGAVMPPFTLSPTDLNNLAAYVYKSTH